MHKNLKSFFLLISSALVLLFVFSSLFSYNYFNLSDHLDLQEKKHLFIGFISIFFLILLILFLFSQKFLLPILNLNTFIIEQKNGNLNYTIDFHFNDEISFIGEHIIHLKKELDADIHELQDLSLSDPLTGVSNRRYFVEFGEKILKLSKRNKEDLSLIMFNIDHFSDMNQKYGKASGDKVISLLTEVTEQHIRKSDIFARYAENIFVLLLPQTDAHKARIVAEKIQSTLKTSDFRHKADTYFTVSMGISSLQKTDSFLRNITQRADQALLEAKENGSNSIYMEPSI